MTDDKIVEQELAGAEEIAQLPSLARHLPRILMPLSAQIDDYCASPDVARNRRLMQFFEFVKSNFADESYAAIQREHLSRENIAFFRKAGLGSLEQKYLDFPYWVHSKFNIATKLALDKLDDRAVLDIGAGPGHFGLVARYLGCDYDGLETLLFTLTPTAHHLFDDLSDYFQINRIVQTVQAFQPLRVKRRYRLLTVLMGNFCSYTTGGGPRTPWSWHEWAFLLDNLASDVLTEEYGMYFHISRNYLPADVVENLRRFAKTFDEVSCMFTFDQSLDLEALRSSAPKAP